MGGILYEMLKERRSAGRGIDQPRDAPGRNGDNASGGSTPDFGPNSAFHADALQLSVLIVWGLTPSFWLAMYRSTAASTSIFFNDRNES
jgi:hypothetical protein